jgi:hypothetical protein
MGKCTGLPAAEPQTPKPQPEQRAAPKRDAARDLKKDSASKKLLKGEVKHLRRGESTAWQKHNREQLGQHLSKLASGT